MKIDKGKIESQQLKLTLEVDNDEINNHFKGSLNSLLLDHFIPWGWGTWSKKWKKYCKPKENSNFFK